ncbi:MAG: sigma-54-dependent Fis family transcriptional regulator [Rubrivivax sp.]|nr:sigma-54-dependent Fis family transcriptional regulator [Rubrivivax sp.]
MTDPDALDDLPCVMLVDDEGRSLDAMRRTLDEEFRVLTADGAEAARERLAYHDVAVILCDQRMPGTTGVQFLKEVRERWPDIVRVVVSGYADSDDIVAGINEAGIFRYVLKPWVPEHLLTTVREAVRARERQLELRGYGGDARLAAPLPPRRRAERTTPPAGPHDFARLARAPGSPLDAVCDLATRVARHDLSVLVLGESGTGKELLARAIHHTSPRAAGPFVVENCAAIPDTLLESELFGHKRGAFTGAVEDHVGLFQRAHGGTVFLDEIGETSPAFQVKLLRVLQEGELRPVGSMRPLPVDVRVIAATHRPLEDDVRAGRFREDLYYRLAGVTLTMPALRDRAGDIGAIAERLREDVCRELGLDPAARRYAPGALAALLAYPWPGNIRELRNEIARALALAHGPAIEARDFSAKVLAGQTGRDLAALSISAAGAAGVLLPAHGTMAERLEAVEAMLLREVMLRHRWNKSRAAQELGLSRVGLRAKLLRYGLEDRSVPPAAANDTAPRAGAADPE